MTHNEYIKLSKDLQILAKKIPLNWGKIQNDHTDKKINMFNCATLESLENEVEQLSLDNQNYFKRRWFLWRCAQVDEYLFYKEENVEKNPNHKDQSWDIKFNDSIQFDVKGTVVPKSFRSLFDFSKEKELIDFYYKSQSKGVRHNIQNRLFIVHHSFNETERSMFLRCYWELKKNAYREFNKLITNSKLNLIKHNSVVAKCIFIIESKENDFYFKII